MDVVIYDGQCNFCRSQIGFLDRIAGKGKLEFLSLHDPSVAERFPDMTHEQMMAEMWIVSEDGKRYGGIDAVRFLSRRLVVLWPLWPLLHIPFSRGFWSFLYRMVARYRYRIAGRNCDSGSCAIHGR